MPSRRTRAHLVACGLALGVAAFTPDAGAQPNPGAAPVEVVPPRPLAPLTAGYPEGAGGDAKVTLVLTINADGSVRSAVPAAGAPEPFASAAVAASAGWRFSPATRAGKPIAAKIRAEIAFSAPKIAPPPEPAQQAAPPAGQAPREPAPPPQAAPIDVSVEGELPAPGVTTFSRAEVRLLPGAFGDPFRAVETLPGVTPLASGVPFFYVRGAPPGNVGYFLDGVRVPLLYHLGLGPSVIHPAIVDRVDLYPGGYPARFGRFAGGIVSGETRDPLPEWHGEANLRLVDAGAMVEGPLGDRGSFFASGRVSYTALLLSAISSDVRLNYWDYSGRATVHLTPREDLTVFAFGAYDYLGQKRYDGVTRTLFDTTFHRLDLRYDHRLGGAEDHLRAAVTMGIDHTGFSASDELLLVYPEARPHVVDRILAARVEVTKRVSPSVLVRAGADGQVDAYETRDLQLAFPRAGGFTGFFGDHTDLALGARADAVINLSPRFEITPGLRFDFFATGSNSAFALDPRLSARLAVTRRVRFIQAHGMASQTPSFIVAGPGFQPPLRGGLQRALQSSAGVEVDLPWDVSASATVFRNAFFNMSDALGTNPVPSSGGSFPDHFGLRALGSSVGLEIVVRRKLTRRLGGFLAYTLSRSERIVGWNKLPSSFDRTHVLNLALSQDFGRGYRTGARLVFYTGYPSVTGRLPPFFRFDWRAEKKWKVGRGWLSLVLEMSNAMLARETLQQTCDGEGCEPVKLGPITVPSIGLEGGF